MTHDGRPHAVSPTDTTAADAQRAPSEPADDRTAHDAPGAVRIRSITKRFGNHLAVDDLSLDIRSGEFLSLLGPSGCGKTTTLRMLAGFDDPDSGEIELAGKSVVGVAPYRRNVNTVFQQYALFPHMNVAENVAYGLQQRKTPKREIREKVAEALELVQMRTFADRKPTMLSGGQQQRVALARAIVNRPAVLLLDEPLGALDRKLREEMQIELKMLQQQLGMTFVFVTHDQGEALSMSDRIAIMREGRIEQLADPNTIYDQPASAYVAAFIVQQNFFDGVLETPERMRAGEVALVADRRSELAGGSRVRGAVRPENVRFAAADGDDAAGPNRALGTLVGISHQGETMQYLIEGRDGRNLIARRPLADGAGLRVGDAVVASWDAADVRLFADDDGPEQAHRAADENLSTTQISSHAE
ncbi:MAG: ABC transporter ATP-binding protein [Microbacteriaceae bacterium]|nr:ABC transporter ATP-binding protein [Microbacteriaceae bacterium]